MLKEIQHVRQIDGEPPRRWFSSSWFDLIVWYSAGQEISGFQLCYAKDSGERAFTWKNTGQKSHFAVDDGENRAHHHKSLPVLVANGAFNAPQALLRFQEESTDLPQDIRNLVIKTLQQA